MNMSKSHSKNSSYHSMKYKSMPKGSMESHGYKSVSKSKDKFSSGAKLIPTK